MLRATERLAAIDEDISGLVKYYSSLCGVTKARGRDTSPDRARLSSESLDCNSADDAETSESKEPSSPSDTVGEEPGCSPDNLSIPGIEGMTTGSTERQLGPGDDTRPEPYVVSSLLCQSSPFGTVLSPSEFAASEAHTKPMDRYDISVEAVQGEERLSRGMHELKRVREARAKAVLSRCGALAEACSLELSKLASATQHSVFQCALKLACHVCSQSTSDSNTTVQGFD